MQIGGTPADTDADDEKKDDDKPTRPGNASERKAVNDAVASIRGLAQLRGRNVEWAELAVREGASLPADEALAAKVIDLVASDVPGPAAGHRRPYREIADALGAN